MAAMAAIDHTAYPAIIDTILSHCSVAGLLVFRDTSRVFRERLTRVLYDHVVLHVKPNRKAKTKEGRREVVAKLGVGPTCTAQSDVHLPWLPSAVRILDIRTPVWANVEPHVTQFTNVQTIRRLRQIPFHRHMHYDGRLYMRVDTSVEYLTLRQEGFHVRDDELYDLIYVAHNRRRVLHVGLQGEDCALCFRIWQAVSAPDFVLVLHGTAAPRAVSSLVAQTQRVMEADSWSDCGRLTVVGARAALGGDDEELQKIKARLASRLADCYWDDGGPPVGVAEELTRFLTMEEWLAELSDEQRDIEAAWPVSLQSCSVGQEESVPTVRLPRRPGPLHSATNSSNVDNLPPPSRRSAGRNVSHARQLQGPRHNFR